MPPLFYKPAPALQNSTSSGEGRDQGPYMPIRYQGAIGNPNPDGSGSMFPFDFADKAPLYLCMREPTYEPDPNPNATGRYLTSLIERHNSKLLHSRNWLCEVCAEPATELYHSAVPRLLPGVGAVPGFTRLVWDTVVPICRSAGVCDVQAGIWAHAFAKEAMPNLQSGSQVCERCGKVTGIRACLGCKVVGYCSHDCQKLDWSIHRRNCILARRETARTRQGSMKGP